MKFLPLFILMLLAFVYLLFGSGCAISNHGVFPKPVWYWSKDAHMQREIDAAEKPSKDWQKDLQKAIDQSR